MKHVDGTIRYGKKENNTQEGLQVRRKHLEWRDSGGSENPDLSEKSSQHQQHRQGGHDSGLEVLAPEDEREVSQYEEDDGWYVDGDDWVADTTLQHDTYLSLCHGVTVVGLQGNTHHL